MAVTADFRLHFDIRRCGATLQPLACVRRTVEKWLAEVEYEEAVRAAVSKRALPEKAIGSGDWTFWFRAIPRREAARGRKPRAGAFGIGPLTRSGGSAVSHRSGTRAEGCVYGDLDDPFLIALNCGDTFVDLDDIVDALYGEPAFAKATTGRRRRSASRPASSPSAGTSGCRRC